MSNLEKIRAFACRTVADRCALPDRVSFAAHLFGVADACALLALRRGLDPGLAQACGLLHDLYTCRTGSALLHAISGAEMARVALKRLGCFGGEKREVIQSAVLHHSDKAHVHGPYDELLKDADVLQPHLRSGGRWAPAYAEGRLRRLAPELGLAFSPDRCQPEAEAELPTGSRENLAGVAEELAARRIEGSPGDRDFQEILRHWPEDDAFEELKNGWCAAFVYHCALKAGFALPIRAPGVSVRFTGVGAWVEWARALGFYHERESGFHPERGDIVIYNNIIPLDKKPAGPWHDHTGVVLAAGESALTVAEGNVGNGNISGIVARTRDGTVGGYVRIPDGFACLPTP